MDWKTMLAYVTGSVDEELLRRNEYLVAENRILRGQIPGRVNLSDGERRTLASIGKRLGRQALAEIASIVRPETILAWVCSGRGECLCAAFLSRAKTAYTQGLSWPRPVLPSPGRSSAEPSAGSWPARTPR